MKILVAVKRVIDPYVKVRVKADNSGIETQNVKMSINPFDEIAVEEALRFKEKNLATEVVVVTIGSEASQDILRHSLALGADRAIHIRSDKAFCSLNVAKILQRIVKDENPQLVFLGKQSIDGDNNQTPQMLAALLDWPQATYVSHAELSDNHLLATREIDGGLETIEVQLPAVLSTDLRLNEPRYASLPNIMKAKSKPLQTIDLDSLGLNLKEHQETKKIVPPSARSAGVKVGSVAELVEKLKNEAKVL
ncbi:electron transfer flavoprotein subunit beta [Legionella adelaidensis]|uniref:Electron transfer flavoprotein subunit beta n=1 Tax=Legionella adelaidensis TaxID=45056 RepID=A0A0W0R428_9GAMM|nr:electron transfer flavoprotein subunit beta/FixA family protein [Legionella adelaidensis]KTC65786.1 electron transfer flavoprotein subunit beta [Legionella adelaidensis]